MFLVLRLLAITVCIVSAASSGPIATVQNSHRKHRTARNIPTESIEDSEVYSPSLRNHESLEASWTFAYIESCGYEDKPPFNFFGVALRECINFGNHWEKYTDSFGTKVGAAYPSRSYIVRSYSDEDCKDEKGTPKRNQYPLTCNAKAKADNKTGFIKFGNSLPTPANSIVQKQYGDNGCESGDLKKINAEPLDKCISVVDSLVVNSSDDDSSDDDSTDDDSTDDDFYTYYSFKSYKYACNGTLYAMYYTNLACEGAPNKTFTYVPDGCSKDPYYGSKSYSYYECTNASSVSNNAAKNADEVCFAGSELVEKDGGDMVPISSIKVGDRILSTSMRGELKYAEVVAVPHAHNEIEALFVTVTTAAADLKLTAEHLLRAGVCGSELSLVKAREVRVGDCAMTAAGPALVIAVGSVKGKGIYSVVTTEELIVVNGFVASPFAVNHFAANAFYDVHRLFYAMAPLLMRSSIFSMVYERFGRLLSSVV